MPRIRQLVLLLLSLACSGAPAAEGKWDLEALMRAFSQRTHAESKFVEQKHLKVLSSPLRTSGRLIYIAPDRLEKLTLQPNRELLLVTGDAVTIERADGKRRTLRLQDYPALWGFIDSIRGTMAGDLDALQRFYAVGMKGSEGNWELMLRPRVQVMRAAVREIVIYGTQARIVSVEVTLAQGDRSVMRMQEAGP